MGSCLFNLSLVLVPSLLFSIVNPPDQLILHPVAGLTSTTENEHPMLTRSKRGIVQKKCFLSVMNQDTSNLSEIEPYSVKTALQVPVWKNAMQAEYDALMKQQTWSLVPLPPDKNLVSCKWIFKIKRNADGLIARHKARLVAGGFSEEYGKRSDAEYHVK
ncbi:hypothetical protein ACLB2K_071131 [Fragaria x ananassa]